MLNISKTLKLPLDFATQTVAILARKRVGKTYTASVIAEECVENNIPFVVLDPTGAWYGLRSMADGKRAGYPVVIIGGSHGDIPLDFTAGKTIAEFIVENPGYYVLDLSGSESDAEQDRFATAFAQRLYRYKDKHREPLHLFVDEADSFAPQNPFPGQRPMLGAFEAIVRRGGIRGLGITMITQRSAVLNNNVLMQAEVMIALQTTGPADIAAVDKWIKLNATKEQRDEFLATVASLGQGEAWVWSPAWLEIFKKVQIRTRSTFNSSATPKVGDVKQEPAKLAEVDLDALRTAMATTIEKAKAEDPKALRDEIARLKKDVANLETAKVRDLITEPIPEKVEIPVFPDLLRTTTLSRLESITLSLDGIESHVREALQSIRERVDGATHFINEQPFEQVVKDAPVVASRKPIFDEATRAKLNMTTTALNSMPPNKTQIDPDSSITGPQQKILDALAFCESIGINCPDRNQLAVFAGYSNNGSFRTYLSQLNMGELVAYPAQGQVQLADKGRPYARQGNVQITGLADLHDLCRAKLSGPQTALFNVLVSHMGRDITRDDLASQAGYVNNGSFRTYLSQLKTIGFVEYPRIGYACASKTLFPEGLA